MNRLENDRSLARFAGQFVPLKLITDGNPQWNQWARKYPVNQNAIPILYVIRADGEKLFAAAGSLTGDQLPQMMSAALQNAGRIFSDAEAIAIEKAVRASESALESQNVLAAATSLASLNALGTLESIGSYAEPALNVESQFEQLRTAMEARIQSATDELIESENPLSAIVALLEVEAAMKAMPTSKAKASEVAKELRQNKSLAGLVAKADSLIKARTLAASMIPRVHSRAESAYGTILRKFPETDIAKMAKEELKALNPDSKFLKPANPTPSEMQTRSDDYRKWQVADGSFSTIAKYLQQKDGKVQLQKRDGKKIVVEIKILSQSDQAFLESAR